MNCSFHGWGVTMFDSLDTMWLMGLEDMFYDTVEDVAGQEFRMPEVGLSLILGNTALKRKKGRIRAFL